MYYIYFTTSGKVLYFKEHEEIGNFTKTMKLSNFYFQELFAHARQFEWKKSFTWIVESRQALEAYVFGSTRSSPLQMEG